MPLVPKGVRLCGAARNRLSLLLLVLRMMRLWRCRDVVGNREADRSTLHPVWSGLIVQRPINAYVFALRIPIALQFQPAFAVEVELVPHVYEIVPATAPMGT